MDVDVDLSSLPALSRWVDEYTDTLSGDAFAILRDDLFAELHGVIRAVGTIPLGIVNRLFDMVLSGLQAMVDAWDAHIGEGDVPLSQTDMETPKRALLRWLALMQTLVVTAEHRSIHAQSLATVATAGTGAGGRVKKTPAAPARKKAKGNVIAEQDWEWESLKIRTLRAILNVLELPLGRFLTDAEREEAVGTVTKSLNELWQNKDRTSLKCVPLKRLMFEAYATCIVSHGYDAQVTIEQNLKFFEFLAEPMAEFLHYLESDRDVTKLTADLLKTIGQTEYTDSSHAKSIATFLTALSDKCPKSVLRNLVYLKAQLDSPEYPLRSAILQCVAAAIQHLFQTDETDHVASLIEVIEERYRDVTAQTRKKALQITSELLGYKYFYAKFPDPWFDLLRLAVSRIQDKNQPVRASAIKTVTQFLHRHPFTLHGETLARAPIEAKAAEIRDQLKVFLDDAEHADEVDAGQLSLLEAQHKYFTHLVQFLDQLEYQAIPYLAQLLASKNKAEVIDTMDFFVEAHALKLPGATVGLGKMWHLVFNVRNSEHLKDIHAHLIACFDAVYLSSAATTAKQTAPAGLRQPDVNLVVRNLITLTYDKTLADLTCLDKIVGMCRQERLIDDRVVTHLWTIFSATKVPVPLKQRRGATLVLSWLCHAEPALLGADQLMLVLRGLRANRDLIFTRSCCQVLQSLQCRLPMDHELFDVMQAVLLEAPAPRHSASTAWYGTAQQVIKTIYAICQQPMAVLNQVIKTLSQVLYTPTGRAPLDHLCRLFFVLGHTAIQQLVYLETIELDYKRKKAAEPAAAPKARARKTASRKSTPQRARHARRRSTGGNVTGDDTDAGAETDNDLEQVVGSAEDVFTDNLAAVRELELLQGASSLLAAYGPLVRHVTQDRTTPPQLRVFAATCLAQFMCLSAQFCEENLPVLKQALRDAPSGIKSNLMVAFGDLIVCWNTVIDEDVNVLYDALRSAEAGAVKKNALMVLLHLILNGMVKVKGQLSALAMCLEDPDDRIAGLTRLFLSELAAKEQALYNNLSDVLSHLFIIGSESANGDAAAAVPAAAAPADVDGGAAVGDGAFGRPAAVDEQAVMRVLKFLLGFITKEKQTENLMDKLCQRLKESESPRQWRAIMYAMSLLPVDTSPEAKTRKLLEHFACYANKLHEDGVYKFLMDIVAKIGKANAGGVGKPAAGASANAALQELTEKITQARNGFIVAGTTSTSPDGESAEADAPPAPPAAARPAAARTRGRRGAGKAAKGRRGAAVRTTRAAAARRRRAVHVSDSEVEEEDESMDEDSD
ncbi:hypothetical protein AMAG_10729 [Allomyces macrogynus ATCC 38327]|uniref:Condensin complex subunit 1 n=1 Tax=Allomyces macrogynus (strain ATCC 38327) TaxID=578462 RepID=A0A0L0SRS3_ALLM3|nr:hypothetical protein AMAG_10729 [Allomyces macrogynus ATCC 38327]|eukprot:KNE65065.1 hypothetical protein AMAG_10729 [Allomyces macrogynus ATCC 38327]